MGKGIRGYGYAIIYDNVTEPSWVLWVLWVLGMCVGVSYSTNQPMTVEDLGILHFVTAEEFLGSYSCIQLYSKLYGTITAVQYDTTAVARSSSTTSS